MVHAKYIRVAECHEFSTNLPRQVWRTTHPNNEVDAVVELVHLLREGIEEHLGVGLASFGSLVAEALFIDLRFTPNSSLQLHQVYATVRLVEVEVT